MRATANLHKNLEVRQQRHHMTHQTLSSSAEIARRMIVISVHGASRTLPCLRPVRQTLHLTAASPSHQRPQCCSGSATSPSLSLALQCQGSHTTTPASPHCAFMCIQGFRFMDVGQPLICRLFRRLVARVMCTIIWTFKSAHVRAYAYCMAPHGLHCCSPG